MKIIPLFGSGQSAKSFTVTDDRRVNVYYELSPDQEKSKVRIYGTPGTMPFASYGAAPARGLHVTGTTLYVVAGNQFLSINTNGAATVLGTLLTSAGLVEMEDNGQQLIIVDGQAGYIYTLVTGSYSIGVVNAGDFRVIASANFPNGATTVAFNTGFFLVEKVNTGQFWKSGSYDGTSWLGTDFATAESNPDNLLAVMVDQGFAILFGSSSIEFWQNTGVQGFPFAPVQGATQEIGLAAKYSRAKWNNTVAFLASNLQGGYQVYATGAGGVTKISNNDIDGLISSFINPPDAIGMSYVVDGHAMYQLNFQRDKRSLVYDASTGIWIEVQSGLDEFARHIANQAVSFNGGVYVSDYSTGSIYKLDENTFTDNSQFIKRMIQTRHIHDEGNVLAIDELFLDMETGLGLQAGVTPIVNTNQQLASVTPKLWNNPTGGGTNPFSVTVVVPANQFTGPFVAFIVPMSCAVTNSGFGTGPTSVTVSDTISSSYSQAGSTIKNTIIGNSAVDFRLFWAIVPVANANTGFTVTGTFTGADTHWLGCMSFATVDLFQAAAIFDGGNSQIIPITASSGYQPTLTTTSGDLQDFLFTTTWQSEQAGGGPRANDHSTIGAGLTLVYTYQSGSLFPQLAYGYGSTSVVNNAVNWTADPSTPASNSSYAITMALSRFGTVTTSGGLPIQGSDPKIMVQVSKDNGHTFGTERLMSIGKVGQYRLRATLRRFGSARDFVFRFKMTDPVKFACTYGAATLRGLGK